MSGKRRDPSAVAALGSLGFVLGLGTIYLFGTERGEKYRKQIGEFSADFLDTIADGCKEIRKSLSK